MMGLKVVADNKVIDVNADIIAHVDGSIVSFEAVSVSGDEWLAEHLPEDCPRLGYMWCVEQRYALDIIEGMIGSGLMVKRGYTV